MKTDRMRYAARAALFLVAYVATMQQGMHGQDGIARHEPKQNSMSNEVQLPVFDVASIRQDEPGYRPTYSYMKFTPDGFIAEHMPLQNILVYAYDLRDPAFVGAVSGSLPKLIAGGPHWIQTDWYNIRAKMSDGDIAKLLTLSRDERLAQRKLALQSLLIDRFKMTIRRETSPGPAYVLTTGKNGPKHLTVDSAGQEYTNQWSGYGGLVVHSATMADLIEILQYRVDCPIIDKTGLSARYSFTLEWGWDPNISPRAASGDRGASEGDPSGVSIFTALQDQLGLKLEPTTLPMENIVIEHVEHPSSN